MPKSLTIEPCVVCSQSFFRKLFEKGGWVFAECKACGTQRIVPFPSMSQIETHYKKKSEAGGNYDLQLQSRRRDSVYEDMLDWFVSFVDTNKLEGALLVVGCFNGEFLSSAKKRGMDVWGLEFNRDAALVAGQHVGENRILITKVRLSL